MPMVRACASASQAAHSSQQAQHPAQQPRQARPAAGPRAAPGAAHTQASSRQPPGQRRRLPGPAERQARPHRRASSRRRPHGRPGARPVQPAPLPAGGGDQHQREQREGPGLAANSAGSSSASSTRAVMTRWRSIAAQPPAARGRRLDAAEAAVALRIGGQRGVDLGGAEVGPQAVGEEQLRVGRLPEQEVADAHLAAGADEQVGVGREAQRHVARQPGLVDLLGLQAFGQACGRPARRPSGRRS
jgi:hypothetical protein